MLPLVRSLPLVLLLVLASAGSHAKTPQKEAAWPLQARRTEGTVDRIETAVEAAGELKVLDQDSKAKQLKMDVIANLNYHERTLQASADPKIPLRSVRYYDKAVAAIQVDADRFTPALREDRRLVGALVDGPQVVLFSPRGPLTREELDLIDVQGCSLAVDRLLPGQPVAVGGTWKPSGDAVAAILRPDAVGASEVQCVLKSVEDSVATVEIEGKVEAAVAGVSTQMEIKGKLLFDLRAERVTWFGLLVRENRNVGHVSPGLEVLARVQMKITPGAESSRLTDAALAEIPLVPTDQLTRLVYQSAGGWEFANDRRWYITSDEAQRAALRLVDRGELVAQCNIATLPQVATEKLRTLAGFQDEIQRGLGKSFERFLEAGQRSNQADYREFRVVAEGKASELPMRWVYYYLADQTGHQVVFAFVVQSDLADRFDECDRELVSTVRLNDPKLAARPEAAAR